ncbi:MAG: YjbH domain-containing protein [Pseudomonadota bacterium]
MRTPIRIFQHLAFGASLLSATASHADSDSLYGPLGLNTVPSARMNESGTAKLGISTLDPYLHGYLGFQLSNSLYVQLRQSAELSDLNDDADRLYPGIDFKLRLMKEGSFRPELSLGVQSAIGHKRMSGEYVALSKRYKDFDFTAGLGWGRFGTAAHIKNPLKSISSHFDRARLLDSEAPSGIENWFTGNDIGLFAGVEYQTPLDGLSLKADYGTDRYTVEKATLDFEAPAPWAIGAVYTPWPWVDAHIAMQGADKIMGRLTFKTNLKNLKNKGQKQDHKNTVFRNYRSNIANTSQIKVAAKKDNITLGETEYDDLYTARTSLQINTHTPTPHQIGMAAKHISNHAGPAIEEVNITLNLNGLKGPTIKLLRKDLENALAFKTGSADEIWRNAEFKIDKNAQIPTEKPLEHENKPLSEHFHLNLEQHLSVSEEDTGLLSRTSLITAFKGAKLFGLFDQNIALRLNLTDNLNRITDLRPRSTLPVRSDVDIFAQRTIALEHSTLGFTHSLNPELHINLAAGYLEEMYAGFGGEMLYRPFKSRFAIGVEAWQAFKRDPFTGLNTGFTGDHVLSAHIKGWYDLPKQNLTLGAEFGRYLAEDIGGSVSLSKTFENGTQLEAFVTLTDQADSDLFGDETHLNHGLRLSIPLTNFKYLPQNTKITTRIEPFARDIGQKINTPNPLYQLTEPLSYSHIARHWENITDQ